MSETVRKELTVGANMDKKQEQKEEAQKEEVKEEIKKEHATRKRENSMEEWLRLPRGEVGL
jgi:hypothetical protein